MKKVLIISAAAVLALVSCAKVSDKYVGAPESREIGFSALSQPATRAAIQSAVFPTANTMEVRAYQSAPTAAEYFPKTTFMYQYLGGTTDATNNPSTWGGTTPRYWPLSAATLNFFALSGNGVAASDMTIADALASAQVQYTAAKSYSETTQSDIMYAFNRASVTQSDNSLSFNGGTTVDGSKVAMTFNHALAVVNFQIKAADNASKAISIYKIELNGARYTGTLDITNTNAATVGDAFSAQLDWTPDAVVNNVVVPNIGNTSTPVALTTSYVPANDQTASSEGTSWAALMIIPKQQKASSPVDYGFTTFKIYYKYDGKDYTYEYAPAGYTSSTPNLTVVEAGKKYTYQISMQLHEITVAPTVTQWTEQNSADNVVIP